MGNEDRPPPTVPAVPVQSTAYDPTAYQIQSLDGMGVELTYEQLCTPEAVRLLIHNQRVTLSQLKKAEGDLTAERERLEVIRKERETLKVEVAKLESTRSLTLVEIPVGMISGFAINLVLIETFRTIGIVLLIISLAIFLMIRGGSLKKWFQSSRR